MGPQSRVRVDNGSVIRKSPTTKGILEGTSKESHQQGAFTGNVRSPVMKDTENQSYYPRPL